jgi:hypothetical protein
MAAIEVVIHVELVDADEASRLVQTLEVESVPVDDRSPPEDQMECLEVVERQCIEGLEALGRSGV